MNDSAPADSAEATHAVLLKAAGGAASPELLRFIAQCRRLGVDDEEVRLWSHSQLQTDYSIANKQFRDEILGLQSSHLKIRPVPPRAGSAAPTLSVSATANNQAAA